MEKPNKSNFITSVLDHIHTFMNIQLCNRQKSFNPEVFPMNRKYCVQINTKLNKIEILMNQLKNNTTSSQL